MVVNVASLTRNKNPDDNAKQITAMVCNYAADFVVAAAIATHLPVKRGILKIFMGLGVVAIGMMVGEKVEEFVCRQWDETKAMFAEAKETAKKTVEEIAKQEKDAGGH